MLARPVECRVRLRVGQYPSIGRRGRVRIEPTSAGAIASMPTNIYVGNLPWSVTNDDLAQLFAQFGTVGRASIVTDRETGRSRGFGFVEMPNDAEAQTAIQALHEQPMNGRPLTVNVAQPRAERGPRGGSGGGYGGGYGGRSAY